MLESFFEIFGMAGSIFQKFWGGLKMWEFRRTLKCHGFYYYYFQFSEVEKLENFFPKSDKFSGYYTAKTHLSRIFPKFLPQKKQQCHGLFRVKSLYVSLHLLTLLKEKESLCHVRFRIQFWFELGTNLLGSETITMYSKFNILVSNNYSILKISFQKLKF